MALQMQTIETKTNSSDYLELVQNQSKKKTEAIQDVDGLTKKQRESLEKIIYMMLAILVEAQSEISLKLQQLLKLDNELQKGTLTFLENFTNYAITQLKKMLVEIQKQEREHTFLKIFTIIGAIAGCVIGFALGGVPGLIIAGVFAGLAMSGAMNKITMAIARGISNTPKDKEPPAWAQAVAGLIITAAAIVMSFGISAASAATEAGLSIATSASSTTESIVEDQMEMEITDLLSTSSDELDESTSTNLDEAVNRNNPDSFEGKFKAKFGNGRATTMAKMAALQALGSTNALGNLWTAFLEAVGVNKKDAEIWGQILGAITLLIAGVGVMRTSSMPQELIGAKAFSRLISPSIAITGLCMIGQGICNIFVAESQFRQADAEQKYGEAKGAISAINAYLQYNHSNATTKLSKQVNNSFASIYRGIGSYSVVANTVAQEILA